MQMTYLEFARAVARGVKRRLPALTFVLSADRPNEFGLALGPAMATIRQRDGDWLVTFERRDSPSKTTMSSLNGTEFTATIADNVATSIAVFLEP
jgi:hypothetical protein